jgi:hypothetical protein
VRCEMSQVPLSSDHVNDPGVVTVGPSNILTNRSIANPPNAEAPMTPAAITTMASNNDGPGACRLAAVMSRLFRPERWT